MISGYGVRPRFDGSSGPSGTWRCRYHDIGTAAVETACPHCAGKSSSPAAGSEPFEILHWLGLKFHAQRVQLERHYGESEHLPHLQ